MSQGVEKYFEQEEILYEIRKDERYIDFRIRGCHSWLFWN